MRCPAPLRPTWRQTTAAACKHLLRPYEPAAAAAPVAQSQAACSRHLHSVRACVRLGVPVCSERRERDFCAISPRRAAPRRSPRPLNPARQSSLCSREHAHTSWAPAPASWVRRFPRALVHGCCAASAPTAAPPALLRMVVALTVPLPLFPPPAVPEGRPASGGGARSFLPPAVPPSEPPQQQQLIKVRVQFTALPHGLLAITTLPVGLPAECGLNQALRRCTDLLRAALQEAGASRRKHSSSCACRLLAAAIGCFLPPALPVPAADGTPHLPLDPTCACARRRGRRRRGGLLGG